MMGLVVRVGWLCFAWWLCTACTTPAKAPPARSQGNEAARASTAHTAARVATYRLSPIAPALALSDATRGVLLDDRRFTIAADGRVTLAEMQVSGLMPPVVMPARLGGGFLFWNVDAVYRARTFTGALEVIAPLPTNAVGFDFGPDTLLIISENSWRRQYTLDGKQVSLSPPNLIDVVASDDGRALAMDAAGRLLASTDAGHHWNAVPRTLSAPITALRGAEDEVWAELRSGGQAQLTPSGQLLERSGPSKPRVAASRPRADADFSQIASTGIELGGGQALVSSGNRFSVVDLASGEVKQGPEAVGEQGSRCEALAAESRWLFVCVTETGQVNVLSGPPHHSPVLERIFQLKPSLWFSDGALLVEGSCDGARDPGRVCVRSGDAHYSEYDFRPALARSGVPEPRVLQWIPRASGAPVALVGHVEADQAARNWSRVTLQPMSAVALDSPLPPLFVEPQTRASSEAASHQYAKQVNGNWQLLPDGSVRGFSSEGSLRIAANGHVEIDSHRFTMLGQRAGRAFAQTADRHFFQSLDFGAHWREVQGPATYSSPIFRYDCSQVGCFLGPWSRLGWAEEPPRAPAPERPAPRPTPEAPLPAPPGLRCEPIGKAHFERTFHTELEPQSYRDLSGGPGATDDVTGRVRAILDGAPEGPRERAGRAPAPGAISASFAEVFDASGTTRRASVSIAAWRAAWPKQAERIPSRGGARPILGASLGHSAGVLLNDDDELAFSAGLGGKLRALPAVGACEYCSSFLDAKGALWLADSKPSGATVLLAADTAKVLFRLPSAYLSQQRGENPEPARAFLPPELGFANNDAIAVGPHGMLAVLRLPSGAEPAGEDSPALLLTADGDVSALAPWSSLELANSAACTRDTSAYRALIQTPGAWLRTDGSRTTTGGMSAIVRWSSARVCLEALEMPVPFSALHLSEPDQPEPRLVARFVGVTPGAAAISKTATLEYRQPVSCSLLPAAHD